MKKPIKPIQEPVEVFASLEIAKTLAFYGLLTGLRALGGDQEARLKQLETSLREYYSKIEVDLSDEEISRFRTHCLKTLDQLFERVWIGEQPLKPDKEQ